MGRAKIKRLFIKKSLTIKEVFKIINSNAQEIECFNSWFDQGIECHILQLGSQKWIKGKIKISVNVEFYPDEPSDDSSSEPPSNLDDISQTF